MSAAKRASFAPETQRLSRDINKLRYKKKVYRNFPLEDAILFLKLLANQVRF